jgi:hypothetical protein
LVAGDRFVVGIVRPGCFEWVEEVLELKWPVVILAEEEDGSTSSLITGLGAAALIGVARS